MPEETKSQPQQDEAETPVEAPAAEAEDQAGEDKLPEHAVTIEDAGTLKKKVTVEIARERIDAKFDEMFGELRRSAQVPGFRIGRVPRRLIEKRFGKEVAEDVRNAVLGEAVGSVLEKQDIKAIGEPDIKLEEITLPDEGSLSFSFEVEVAPEFELPEYKGIEIRRANVELTDQRVEEALTAWRRGYATFRPVTGEVQADDMVVADAVIRGEGIDFRAANLEFRVAPVQIEGIPMEDLPEVLAGHKPGDTCEMKTTVPSAHPNEGWRDKEVTVTLSLQEVKRMELPEVDEKLAGQAGFDSVEELREAIRSNLQMRLAAEQQKAMSSQVHKYFLDNADFEVPEGVASRHASRLLARRYVHLMMQGTPREQIDQQLAELEAAAASQAARDLKLTFVLAKLVEAEGIKVEDDEVNARIAQMARRQKRRPERLRQEMANEGTLEQLTTAIGEEKAVEKVLESAKIVDVAPGAAQEETKAPRRRKGDSARAKKKAAARKKGGASSKKQ